MTTSSLGALIEDIRRRALQPSSATDQAERFPASIVSPVDEQTCVRVEVALGRRLPTLIRDLYQSVGNGGFGPGYGLLPLVSDQDEIDSVLKLYAAFRLSDSEDPEWSWPEQLVPICDWGCAIYSCVDCSSPAGAVVTFDPNVRGPSDAMADALAVTHLSVESWFKDWITGVKIWDLMFEEDLSRARTGINPFTKEPLTVVPNKLRRRLSGREDW